MWWGYNHGFGFVPFVFPFGFFIFALLCFIAVRIFFARRFGWRGCQGPYGAWEHGRDAEALLRRRLANGDVTEEEYSRLRDLLRE